MKYKFRRKDSSDTFHTDDAQTLVRRLDRIWIAGTTSCFNYYIDGREVRFHEIEAVSNRELLNSTSDTKPGVPIVSPELPTVTKKPHAKS